MTLSGSRNTEWLAVLIVTCLSLCDVVSGRQVAGDCGGSAREFSNFASTDGGAGILPIPDTCNGLVVRTAIVNFVHSGPGSKSFDFVLSEPFDSNDALGGNQFTVYFDGVFSTFTGTPPSGGTIGNTLDLSILSEGTDLGSTALATIQTSNPLPFRWTARTFKTFGSLGPDAVITGFRITSTNSPGVTQTSVVGFHPGNLVRVIITFGNWSANNSEHHTYRELVGVGAVHIGGPGVSPWSEYTFDSPIPMAGIRFIRHPSFATNGSGSVNIESQMVLDNLDTITLDNATSPATIGNPIFGGNWHASGAALLLDEATAALLKDRSIIRWRWRIHKSGSGQMTITPGPITAFQFARRKCSQWIEAFPGTFHDETNWRAGTPDAEMNADFGQIAGASEFEVDLATHTLNRNLRIMNQRTVLDLNGFSYTLTNDISIGVYEVAHLSALNGVLSATITTVGNFGSFVSNALLDGKLTNRGVLRPGNPTGPLTVTGIFIQQNSGILDVNISPTAHSHLALGNTALIGGTLKVNLINDASPQIDDSYTILSTPGTLAGTFKASIFPDLGPDRVMLLQYGSLPPPVDESSNGQDGAEVVNSGIRIVIGTLSASPSFGDPNTFFFEGTATGVVGAKVSNLPVARDIGLSVKSHSPSDAGSALILLNQSDGTTYIPVVVPVGREPSGIVAARFGDGSTDDDFAVPNKADNSLSVLFHEGNGVYTVIYQRVGSAPSAVASADFDTDGFDDIAVTNEADNTITILRNNGDRTFTLLPSIGVGNGPNAIVAGDLTSDLLPDLIVSNAIDNSLTILSNSGGGVFVPSATATVGIQPGDIEIADLDNDQDLDIVSCNQQSGTISLLMNLGGGTFAQAVHLPVDGTPSSMTSWDMDDDADIDLAVIVNNEQLGSVVRILRNDSILSPGNVQIAFTLLDPIGEGEDPRFLSEVDVTGDDAEDLVTVNVTSLPYTDDGKSNSSLAIRSNLVNGTQVPGDVNGDGIVNVSDLLAVVSNWGPCANPGNCPPDLAPPGGDGIVNIQDLLMVIANWG